MALQTENALAMAALGVLGDSPVDDLQPKLVDAIHLRWAFGPARSFPWYGYYLFRRPHTPQGEEICILGELRDLGPADPGGPPQPLGSAFLNTPLGTFTSDRNLVVTDDFPPPFFGEMDLRDRSFLRFTCVQPARRIRYEVGLREGDDHNELICVHWEREDIANKRNPRKKGGVRFTSFDHLGNPMAEARVRPTANGMALDMGFTMEIELPCAASEVILIVGISASPGKVRALDELGNEVDVQPLNPGGVDPVEIALSGDGTVRVVIEAPQNEAVLYSLCYLCAEDRDGTIDDFISAGGQGPLVARFFAGATLLHEEPILGVAGDIVGGEFSSDLLTAVEFSGGNAALIDICYESVRDSLLGGWEPVEDCPQPISLPVRDADYPASGALPTNLPASEGQALDRIRYGDPNDWAGPRFAALHGALHEMVDGGPGGPEMKDIGADNVPGSPAGPADQQPPTLDRFRPQNYLLLGSFYAPVAQMLGLYWADMTAIEGEAYDYLIIADYQNVAQGDAIKMLSWLSGPTANFTDIDAWICFNRSLGQPPPLGEPADVAAYALPGTTVDLPDGTVRDMTNNAGLTWTIDKSPSGKLAFDEAAMYLVRRAAAGDVEPPAPIATGDHKPVTDMPILVTDPEAPPGTDAERPPDWPDVSLAYIDSGLDEGWYSYRVNGIDLFGRFSAASAPAAWHQWTPQPDPRPWYYDDAVGDGVVNPHAVGLLDKIAPPPPTAVEAFALDPEDPYLVRDNAYTTWFATLSPAEQEAVVGLRVRWLWTYAHIRQAPDTTEFRVYYSDGQPNVLKGDIVSVAPDGAAHSSVGTNIAHTQGANAFQNTYLRAGGRSFRVTASSSASPLQLTVENLAPDDSIVPAAGIACSITISPGHALYLDSSRAPNWQERVWVVPFNEAAAEGVLPAPAPGAGDDVLAGEGATAVNNQLTLPVGTDISAIRPFYFHLFLAEDTARPNRIYRIRAVNAATRTVTLDGQPSLTGGVSGWELGQYVRRYELFLPVPGDADRSGLNLPTSTAQPMAYGQVGVTAVDDKPHTADDPARSGDRWGDRTGNESSVGGPATVYRVHRIPPPPPQMPEDSDAVFASRADYLGKSYYTFRWLPHPNVDAHIFRAMDETLYGRDWEIRQTRSALSGVTHDAYFPQGWNGARRDAAAAELTAINDPGDYAALSADALDVLGRLPGNEGYRSSGNLAERDWLIRRTRSSLNSGDQDFFPDDWADALKRQAAADVLNAIQDPADYASLSNDGMRVLAGLPGNETAFLQLTDRVLPNSGSETANRLGPDNPQSFVINPTLRAYVAEIDGRSTNKYFFRVAFVDGAQNTGPLGLSSPPVYLPDVLPPRAPVFTRVLAGDPDPSQPGDRKITLRWTSNREVDLDAYRVYRTDNEKDARDIRLMNMVQEITVLAGDPAARPAEVVWLDDTVLGLVTYHYCLVAVDTAGNQSTASTVIAARAFDTALPEAPQLTIQWTQVGPNTRAEISWNSPHEVLIQRREGTGNWIDLAQWRPSGNVTIHDPFSLPTNEYQYRAIARKYTGARTTGEAVVLAPQ